MNSSRSSSNNGSFTGLTARIIWQFNGFCLSFCLVTVACYCDVVCETELSSVGFWMHVKLPHYHISCYFHEKNIMCFGM